MSYALLQQNKDVMTKYKMYQNVMIHPQPARKDNKLFGTIVGFALNCMGEVILEIKIAVEGPVGGCRVEQYHPLSEMNHIEAL